MSGNGRCPGRAPVRAIPTWTERAWCGSWGSRGTTSRYLDPKTGKFERYEIEEGTHPHNLVVAPDGMVWFTGNRNGRLVKLDPGDRKLTNYPMPDPKVEDPHTMVLDRAGNAWFTAQNAGVVGRLDAKSGKIRLWETGAGTRPYGIEVDAKQRPWYVLFGTNAVGTIDPATMKERRFELPEGARPRRLTVTKDAIWYGDYARGYLGRLDPATGKVTEFAMPAGAGSLPYAMAGDDKGKIWLAETGRAAEPAGGVRSRGRARSPTAWRPREGRSRTPFGTWCSTQPTPGDLVRHRPEHGGPSPGALIGCLRHPCQILHRRCRAKPLVTPQPHRVTSHLPRIPKTGSCPCPRMPQPVSSPEGLRFDEPAGGAGAPTCAQCQTSIAEAYYEVNGHVVCPGCKTALERSPTGSGASRLLRATAFGLGGAIVGAGVYYAILAVTGYEIGLVAIAVGWLVGRGVQKGSHGIGGWAYQAIAVGLTYLAIVSTYVPFILKAVDGGRARGDRGRFGLRRPH